MIASLQQRHDTFKGHIVFFVLPEHIRVVEAESFLPGTVQQDIFRIIIQLAPGRIQAVATLFQDGLHHTHGIGLAVLGQGRKHTLTYGQSGIRNNQFLVKLHMAAQPCADRAGTVGAIERKHAGSDLRQADAAVHAGKVLAEHQKLSVHYLDISHPLPQLQSRFQGVSQAHFHAFPHHQAVNDHFYSVLLVLFQLDILVHIEDFPVNAHPHIALMADMVQDLLVLTLLAPHHLGHDQQFCPLGQFLQLIQHLVNALLGDGLAALGAVGPPRPGVQEAQIVVDFRHRPHSRAGIVAGGLLVNGDSRGKAVYLIHIRLVHLPQKLTGIRRQRLHIPPLSLSIYRIEGQGGFAGTGQPCHHHQLVPGNVHIDILQVMGTGALDFDELFHQLYTLLKACPPSLLFAVSCRYLTKLLQP